MGGPKPARTASTFSLGAPGKELVRSTVISLCGVGAGAGRANVRSRGVL